MTSVGGKTNYCWCDVGQSAKPVVLAPEKMQIYRPTLKCNGQFLINLAKTNLLKEFILMSTKSSDSIYQLKITLQDCRPPIWRRMLVPGSVDLFKLHQIIQIAMGWTDSHLHQFIIDGEFYRIPSEDDWGPVIDERQFTLEQIVLALKKAKFIYEYDFGDGWRHDVLVEKTNLPTANEKYPQCIKGKRACPPEDVGGIYGYEDLLDALQDESHEEHESYLEWLGGEFDPEAFDLVAINQELCQIK